MNLQSCNDVNELQQQVHHKLPGDNELRTQVYIATKLPLEAFHGTPQIHSSMHNNNNCGSSDSSPSQLETT